MKQKLGIYARQSREKETNSSIEDQILQGTLKAKQLNMPYQTYIDRGESAAYDNFDNRPGFRQLLEDVKNGIITAVFVIDSSRLTRNEMTNLLIKQAFQLHNITIYTHLDGTINYEDSNSVLLNDIRTLFAQKYVADTSKKIKAVLRNRVADGKAHGAAIKPYGYTSDRNKMLIIDPAEAEVVRKMYGMALKRIGSKTIAATLNKEGIPTKTQKYYAKQKQKGILSSFKPALWAPNTVLRILQNPLYKGDRVHKGETFSCPAIIDPETWESVQIQIRSNRNAPGLSAHNYLLKNLCYCGRCGSNFCGRTRPNRKDHIYYCASKRKIQEHCGIRGINIDALESTVWFMISSSDFFIKKAREEMDKLKDPEHRKQLVKEKERLEQQIKSETNNKLSTLKMLQKELLTEEEAELEMTACKENIREFSVRLREIEAKLESEDSIRKNIDEVEEFINQWSNLVFSDNFDLQYALVRMVVNKVVVDFNDKTELYTVQVHAKIPHPDELYTFSLDIQGMLIGDNEGALKQQQPVFTHEDKSKNMLTVVGGGEYALITNSERESKNLKATLHKEHSDIAYRMMWRAKRPYRHQ